VVSDVAYCQQCKCLVPYAAGKFVDHQGGGLRPNGQHCSASLQVVPPVVVPVWEDNESDEDFQLYQMSQKKRKRK
jgi:hypothetical protein